MSVQAMSWVIEKSRHKGGSLLVLLMIANHAKSDGSGAWPSVETIARECRMSERQVRRIIDGVLEKTELAVVRKPGRPHLYDIPGVRGETISTLDKMSDPEETSSEQAMSDPPGHSSVATSDLAVSDEPKATIKNHQRPPNGGRDEVWDILVAVFGPAPTTNKRGAWNVAAKELREQGATPEEIVLRVARYKARWKDAACTPKAIADNWGLFAEDTPASRPVSKIERDRAERRMREQARGGSDRGNGTRGMVLEHGAGDVRHLGEGDR